MPDQTAPATKPDEASTKHLVVDRRYAAILHEDFPTISAATILDALSGEPCKQAISLCAWATRAEDPAGALLAWSRKHHKGQHRRCGRGRGLPTERPDRRHGIPPQPPRPWPGLYPSVRRGCCLRWLGLFRPTGYRGGLRQDGGLR